MKKHRGAAMLLAALTLSATAGCAVPASDGAPGTSATAVGEPSAAASVPAEPNQPVSGSNATRMAKDYLDTSAFSRSGLIKQLVFEGFTNGEATQAVDGLNEDWSAQAAKMAKDYLDTSAFSRSGLIQQLESEGFTTEQATYGAESAGL